MPTQLIRFTVLMVTLVSLLGLYATLGCRASLELGDSKSMLQPIK